MMGMAKQTIKVSLIALRLNWKKLQSKPSDTPMSLLRLMHHVWWSVKRAKKWLFVLPKSNSTMSFSHPSKKVLAFMITHVADWILSSSFVEHGYAVLLEEMGNVKARRKLQDGKCHVFQDVLRPGFYTELDPKEAANTLSVILLTDFEQAPPSMNVVRFLVENFHIVVNQRHYKSTYLDNRYEMLP
jgi:hypothetical protein